MLKKLKEKLSEALEIPKEITMDFPRVTLIGKNQMYVENGKGIVTYTDSFIRIHTSCYFFQAEGGLLGFDLWLGVRRVLFRS